MAVCPSCNEKTPEGAKFCPYCGEALKVTDLPAREIASIQEKIKSYRMTQWLCYVSGFVCAVCAGIGVAMDNTGLMATSLAIAVFSFIAAGVYSTLADRERKKL